MADVVTSRCPFCGALTLVLSGSQQTCSRCDKILSISAGEVIDPSPELGFLEENQAESTPPKPQSFAMKIGPYRLKKAIGKGGMGLVYEAEDTRLKRRVAVKILEHREGVTDQIIERFRQESRNGARLKHPHITSVHDIGSDGLFDYFTMDLVNGTRLNEWWGRPEVTIKSRLVILEKVTRAIAYAHKQGIVHRDIKPGNIMVDLAGEPQVMDFGMACNIDEGPGIASSGSMMGTPAYMSPEQLNEKTQKIGPCSDIWSLGVLLYEALVLKNPFQKPSVKQTHYAVVHQDPMPLCKMDTTISKDLEMIVMKCLRKRPEERYLTAELLADDMRSWLKERPIRIQHESWVNRLIRKIWKPKSISVHEFIEVQEARQKAEAHRIKLEANVETETKRDWKLVFEENFFEPHLESRWEIFGAQHELKNGELLISGGEPQILYYKKPITGNVKIEFDCRQEGEYLGDISCFLGSYYLKNRKKACETGYMFQYGAHHNTRTFIERNNIRIVDRVESPIIAGNNYRVTVEREGIHLRMSVNNKVIFDLEDSEPLVGSERSSIGFYGWRSTTYYSNIKIYRLGASLKADLLELAHHQMEKEHYAAANDLFLEIAGSTADPQRSLRAKRGSQAALMRMGLERQFPDVEKQILSLSSRAIIKMSGDGFSVDITRSNIKDLSPLKGLRISELMCDGNLIESLEPLRGMALTSLRCSKNLIKSLDPLKGMPLKLLDCSENQISDLEALRGMPIKHLVLSNNKVKNLDPLSALSLTNLYLSNNEVSSLQPLRGQALIKLSLGNNPVSSLEPLQGMSLDSLGCARTRIANLDPLRGMNLRVLFIDETPITSLMPIDSKILTYLHCSRTSLTSLEPFIEDRPPPRSFLFDADTLPLSELVRAYEKWKNDPKSVSRAKTASILIALRTNDYVKLRKLATAFQGRSYLLIQKRSTWPEAKEICEKMGGHLSTITSEAQISFLNSMMQDAWPYYWLGFSVSNGKASWINGEPFDESRAPWSSPLDVNHLMNSSKPHVYYGLRDFSGWQLIRQSSNEIFPFIVEWDS
jgi:serine/threonine protein kinase